MYLELPEIVRSLQDTLILIEDSELYLKVSANDEQVDSIPPINLAGLLDRGVDAVKSPVTLDEELSTNEDIGERWEMTYTTFDSNTHNGECTLELAERV